MSSSWSCRPDVGGVIIAFHVENGIRNKIDFLMLTISLADSALYRFQGGFHDTLLH